MKITVEIPEDELKEAVMAVVAREYKATFSADRRMAQRVVAECVREIIYKEKAEIVDRIVAQASRECRSKAVKKLLESIEQEE